MRGRKRKNARAQSNGAMNHYGVCCDSHPTSGVNLNTTERVLSAIAGGLLVKRNLGRVSLSGLAKLFAGTALLRRGVTGHCDFYETMNVSSVTQEERVLPGASEKSRRIRAEMTVQMPPFETYKLWRDPANQSWIMGHFAKVDSISMDRTHWRLRSPMGVEWDSLIVADSPGEFLSWESLPGAGLPNEGIVRFLPTETGGTRVHLEARFDPPAGGLGMGFLRLVGVTPESVVGKALRRFKSMAEMGLPRKTSQSDGSTGVLRDKAPAAV